MEQVKNMNTLKAMAKRGFVQLDGDTGSIVSWYGLCFRTYYVWDGKSSFEYKGKRYITKYVDGCFKPYVFKLK